MTIRQIGRLNSHIPLLITVPHSGEIIPPEAGWLREVPEPVLLTDVDRFVDRLYEGAVERLSIPMLTTKIHRYAADLNRYPEDIDAASVVGAKASAGSFSQGFHWVETTHRFRLMNHPIERPVHDEIVQRYHDVFHANIEALIKKLRARFPEVFHLDCHSMPSRGTSTHADQGAIRPQVVISDFEGKSSGGFFRDTVLGAFRNEGFEVSYNWPYKGGRITQRYGRPGSGHHALQIELNRSLYLDEETRLESDGFSPLAMKLELVLEHILESLMPLFSK